jgi:hypothetical protein
MLLLQVTLKGIPERAKLRPTSKLATTHTLGTVPADSPYAKAWRSIKRKAVRAAGKGKGAEDAAAKVREQQQAEGCRLTVVRVLTEKHQPTQRQRVRECGSKGGRAAVAAVAAVRLCGQWLYVMLVTIHMSEVRMPAAGAGASCWCRGKEQEPSGCLVTYAGCMLGNSHHCEQTQL